MRRWCLLPSLFDGGRRGRAWLWLVHSWCSGVCLSKSFDVHDGLIKKLQLSRRSPTVRKDREYSNFCLVYTFGLDQIRLGRVGARRPFLPLRRPWSREIGVLDDGFDPEIGCLYSYSMPLLICHRSWVHLWSHDLVTGILIALQVSDCSSRRDHSYWCLPGSSRNLCLGCISCTLMGT